MGCSYHIYSKLAHEDGIINKEKYDSILAGPINDELADRIDD